MSLFPPQRPADSIRLIGLMKTIKTKTAKNLQEPALKNPKNLGLKRLRFVSLLEPGEPGAFRTLDAERPNVNQI